MFNEHAETLITECLSRMVVRLFCEAMQRYGLGHRPRQIRLEYDFKRRDGEASGALHASADVATMQSTLNGGSVVQAQGSVKVAG